MSQSSKMNMGRDEFSNLLKFMKAECLDKEAHLFFDFLLQQKIKLYQKLYPHFNFQLSGISFIDAVSRKENVI